MTEEEKKEYEEFLAWKRAKAAAEQAGNGPEKATADEKGEAGPAYNKTERPGSHDVHWMRVVLLILGIAGVVLLSVLLARSCHDGSSCSDGSKGYAAAADSEQVEAVRATDAQAEDAAAAEEERAVAQEPATRWKYEEQVDQMSDKTAYFATIQSSNIETFDFPHQGGSYMYLTVRESPQYGTDVIIRIVPGMFNTHYDGTSVKVRFDDEKAYNVSCNEPDDRSNDVLFLTGAKSFISKLKSHKRLLINAEFYQEGVRTFTFDIDGLQWEH